MTIVWNKVTWYSKFLAVVVFFLALVGAFYLGMYYEQTMSQAANLSPVHEGLPPPPALSQYQNQYQGQY